MIKFPDNFYFGSATSAEQSEGRYENDGKGLTTWDMFYKMHKNRFHDGIGPSRTSRVYEKYIEDIELYKKTGHSAFRTSISWARLFPDDSGIINEKAVLFYKEYFRKLKEANICVMVNLYHFDTPLYLEEKYGGFVSKKTVEEYVKYAKTCFLLFGDLVKIWFTFNEPIVSVECGYLLQYHYPMEVNSKKASQVAYNMQLASSLAIKEFHKIVKDGKIGIILNLTPAYPRSNSYDDLKAARIANLFASKSFLDPSVLGKYPKELVEICAKHNILPEYTQEELDIIKGNTVDILGINYYQPLRVCSKDASLYNKKEFMPDYYYDNYIMPGRRINKYRGWEIYPKGIYDIAINIKENYNNIPYIISENGMGVENEKRFKKDGIIQDDYRIEFFKEHLEYLHKGMQEGSNCFGYMVWTGIDCWSWLNAYKNRYGLIELNYETGERTIKKSGYWFDKLNRNKGFDMEEKLIFLKPFMKEIIWGGDKIKKEFNYETESEKIGEAWIVSANENGMSYVTNGKYAKMSLKKLYEEHRELFGNTTTKDFPLLIKYIDAKDDLSVQVHPDDNYARKVEGEKFNGKSEAWYILDAIKDAKIEIGHTAKTKEMLREMIDKKEWDKLLSFRPVKKGDFFDIAPGTVHAIKKGTFLLEVQQNSDITYRFYDYDRLQNGKLRELHIEKSIDVTTCPHNEDNSKRIKKDGYELLVDNEYFKMKKYVVDGTVEIQNDENFVIMVVLNGSGEINDVKIQKGDNFIIPYGYNNITLKGNLELMHIVSNK